MGSQRVGHDLEIIQHHHSMPSGEVGIATPALGSSLQKTRTFTSLPSRSHFFGLVWTVNRCRLGMAMPLEGGGGLLAKSCLTPMDWEPTQAPLSVGFSRQEYWSGLPFPSPEDLPDPEIEPRSPAVQADFLPTELQGGREVPSWVGYGRRPLCRLLKSAEFTNSEWEADVYLAFSVLCLGFCQL